MMFGRFGEKLKKLGHNGLQTQLRELKGCGFGEVYVVFPEMVSVDYRIMACSRWLEKKGRCDIQNDDIAVAGFVVVGLDRGIEYPKLLVVQLFVFAW